MFLVDLEILASHPIEEYAAFLEFIFKSHCNRELPRNSAIEREFS